MGYGVVAKIGAPGSPIVRRVGDVTAFVWESDLSCSGFLGGEDLNGFGRFDIIGGRNWHNVEERWN